MAQRGYLGKISAIVTINTSSVKPSLDSSAKDINDWSRRTSSRIRGAADSARNALDGIFTPLQKLQAAIKNANRNQLDLKVQNPGAYLQLAKTSEQIFKPLGDIQKQFAGLSSNIQAELLPVLQSAQKQATGLFTAITSGAKVSGRDIENTAARIERLNQVIRRSAEANQLARGGRTGNELAFAAPRTQDELSRSAQLSQRAAEAPVALRADPGFRQRIQELDELRQKIVQYQSAVDRRQVLGLDTREAQAHLDSLIRRSADARRALEQVTSGADEGLIARAKAQQEFYAESERLQKQAAADAAAPLIARARAEQDYYAESERLQKQAAADAAAPLIARARAEQDFYAESTRLQNAAAADAAAPLIARARAEQEFYAESKRLQEQAAADQAAPLIARARAEQDFYAESTRLQNAAAADAAAPLIARAKAEQEFYAESKRLQEQAAADAAAPLIARAKAEQEFYEESQRLQKQAAEDAATPLIRRVQAQRDTAIDFGLDIDAPKRQIDVLKSSIVSLKGQIDTLPVGIRQQFVPALLSAQQNLERLASLPAATVEELSRAEAEVNRLSASAARASKSFGFLERFGGGAGGFDRIFQDQALRGYTAQLDVLQNALSRASSEARGPGVAAFARLRDAIFRAARGGTLEFESTQQEIRGLTQEAVNAASAVAGIGRGTLGRQLQRAGDIGRAGFDKFGLGLQQAAFAIDDFFSVTGGIEQRLRAVGNNLTQLGFIVGGTAGLFTALAFTAGTQIVLAIAKFVRGGAEAKEIAAGINERLERQKTLLKDVSTGFEDIGDNIAENAFSEATKRAETFEKRLTTVIEKLKELRDNAADALDPELALASGRLGTLEKSLKEADSVPLAAARRALVRDANQQVQDIRDRAAARGPIGRPELEGAVSESFGAQGRFVLPQGASNQLILEILQRRELDLAQTVDSWISTFIEPFRQAETRRRISVVAEAIGRLESDIANGLANLTQGAFSDSARRFQASSSVASRLLGQAQGVGGETQTTRSLQSGIERDASRFRAAVKQFNDAVADGRQDEAEKAVRLLSAIADSANAREREAKAIRDSVSAAARFTDVLQQFRELNDTILGDVTAAAQQARREAVQAAGTSSAGLSRRDDSELAQRRSERLQRELRDAEARRRDIESNILEAERRFRQESPDQNVRRLVEESARARATAEDPTRSDRARADARQRLIEADQRLRRGFEASPQGRALQAQLDDADRRSQVALSRDTLITRGRELSRTDGLRAGRELGESLRAINAEFDDRVVELQRQDPFADLAAVEADRQAALGRARQDALRATAPAVFALQDAVQTALLQGPSRAALNAADVTTVEGSRELNRLLRGDDPARDVNLLELQKQTANLASIDKGIQDLANKIGVAQ